MIASGSAIALSFAADFYRRYPGETLNLFVRLDVQQPVQEATLQITLPRGLSFVNSAEEGKPTGIVPLVAQDEAGYYLIWKFAEGMTAPQRIEFRVETRVLPVKVDFQFESQALLVWTAETGEEQDAEEWVSVAVKAKGRYLKYMPSIYQDDDLMGRLLMLFESFLGPIEQQIEHQSNYFDPRLTPPQFLPWLSSWLNQDLDENLPESSRRKLVEAGSDFLKHRGTAQELQKFLEIYSGGKVQIAEHLAKDFTLGSDSYLGRGVAFGKGNQPNTFTVTVRLPKEVDTIRAVDRMRREQALRRNVTAIIEAEKPAHAAYDLKLEYE